MSTFNSLARPEDFTLSVGARDGTSGFQGAHVHSSVWWTSNLPWLNIFYRRQAAVT